MMFKSHEQVFAAFCLKNDGNLSVLVVLERLPQYWSASVSDPKKSSSFNFGSNPEQKPFGLGSRYLNLKIESRMIGITIATNSCVKLSQLKNFQQKSLEELDNNRSLNTLMEDNFIRLYMSLR